VAVGNQYCIALKNDGTVWAWGDAIMHNKVDPFQVKNIKEVKHIEAGGSNSVAIKNDGTVFVWGENTGITGYRNITVKPYCVQLKKE